MTAGEAKPGRLRSWTRLLPRTGWGALAWLAAATAAWFILAEPERRAGWVEARGPKEAWAGGNYPVRIRVNDPDLAGRLMVSLRWTSWDRGYTRSMTSGASAMLEADRGEYAFELPVRDIPDLAFVHLVAYVAPSGRWADRITTASSEPIPVRRGPRDSAPAPERKLRMRLPDPRGGAVHPETSAGLRRAAGGLWLAVAAGGAGWAALRRRRIRAGQGAFPGIDRDRRWMAGWRRLRWRWRCGSS